MTFYRRVNPTWIACWATLFLAACVAEGERPLQLHDAWVRAMPPGSGMTAAYGVFENHGLEPLVITQFASDRFEDVSLHQTVVENGLSRMEPVPELVVLPGGKAVLAPGGLHLMLVKPLGNPPRPGERVGVILVTSDGVRLEWAFQVRNPR